MSDNHRLHTIDAMRGIAALAVALYHIHIPAFQAASGYLIDSIHRVLSFGFLGVPVFFAISGFVISGSIARVNSAAQLGQFMAKRSVRLDPAYWSSIALDIALTAIAIRLALPHGELPGVKDVLLHLLYLQNIAGVENIVTIYWTLCLEIQFYLVLGFIMAIGKQYRRQLLVAVTAYSMLVAIGAAPSLPGLFLSHWCMFIVGAAAQYYGTSARDRYCEFFGIMAAMLAVIAIQLTKEGLVGRLNLAAAWSTALIFYVGAIKGSLREWLNYRPMRYLGSRSYSIYLFHTIVGERAAKLAVSLLGGSAAVPLIAVGIGIGALIASIIASEIMFRLIEQPTSSFSRRLFAGSTITSSAWRDHEPSCSSGSSLINSAAVGIGRSSSCTAASTSAQ